MGHCFRCLFYVTIYSKTESLKAIIKVDFASQVLRVKHLGATQLDSPHSESLMGCSFDWPGLWSHLKARLGLQALPPKWVTYMAGCCCYCQEASIYSHRGLSPCCLSVLTTAQLHPPEWTSQETKEKAQCLLWPNSEVRHGCLWCNLLVTEIGSHWMWKGNYKGPFTHQEWRLWITGSHKEGCQPEASAVSAPHPNFILRDYICLTVHWWPGNSRCPPFTTEVKKYNQEVVIWPQSSQSEVLS